MPRASMSCQTNADAENSVRLNDRRPGKFKMRLMRPPDLPILPLQFAAEVLLDISTMRDECANAARVLTSHTPVPEQALEECAQLDDALALSERAIRSAMRWIQRSRAVSNASPGTGTSV